MKTTIDEIHFQVGNDRTKLVEAGKLKIARIRL